MRTDVVVYEPNEQGEFEQVDLRTELQIRNDQIKSRLQEAYETLKKEKDYCVRMKSKERFGGRFAIQLDRVLRSYGLMSAHEFINLTYEQIEENYNAFLDLISFYNLAFEIVPNKQLFCAFARLNIRHYSQLENSNDSDIKDLMSSINDSLISLGFMSTESGNADGKSTFNRLTLHGAGHGLIKENEKQVIDKFGELPTMAETDREYEVLFGKSTPKRLNK